MAISRQLYDHLPLYSRMLDQDGILEHFCLAIQPYLDEFERSIDRLEVILDPDIAPAQWLDWLGQFVGLGPIGDRWLGVGLNPEWSAAHKRKVINRAWLYWQTKGTNWGIREAIALWLQWEEAHSDRMLISMPLGNKTTSEPPGWWDWYTPFEDWRTERWNETKRLGSGDYPQIAKPSWQIVRQPVYYWEYGEVWPYEESSLEEAESFQGIGSAMGRRHAWQHLHLEDDREWQQIFPDILELNQEIWGIHAIPSTFGWLEDTDLSPILLKPKDGIPTSYWVDEFEVEGFQYSDSFPFAVEIKEVVASVLEAEARPIIGSGQWETYLAIASFEAGLDIPSQSMRTELSADNFVLLSSGPESQQHKTVLGQIAGGNTPDIPIQQVFTTSPAAEMRSDSDGDIVYYHHWNLIVT